MPAHICKQVQQYLLQSTRVTTDWQWLEELHRQLLVLLANERLHGVGRVAHHSPQVNQGSV